MTNLDEEVFVVLCLLTPAQVDLIRHFVDLVVRILMPTFPKLKVLRASRMTELARRPSYRDAKHIDLPRVMKAGGLLQHTAKPVLHTLMSPFEKQGALRHTTRKRETLCLIHIKSAEDVAPYLAKTPTSYLNFPSDKQVSILQQRGPCEPLGM